MQGQIALLKMPDEKLGKLWIVILPRIVDIPRIGIVPNVLNTTHDVQDLGGTTPNIEDAITRLRPNKTSGKIPQRCRASKNALHKPVRGSMRKKRT